MFREATRLLVVLCVLAFALEGCMASPRDGQEIASKNQRIPFSGYTINPGEWVRTEVQSQQSGAWVDNGSGAASATSGHYDGTFTWHAFTHEFGGIWPAGPSVYWRSAPAVNGQRRVRQDIRAIAAKSGTLYTFATSADSCVNSSATPSDAIVRCASQNTPEAQVFLKCGKAGQACCEAFDLPASAACDTRSYCNGSKQCVENRVLYDDAANLGSSELKRVSWLMARLAAAQTTSVSSLGFGNKRTITKSFRIPLQDYVFPTGVNEIYQFVGDAQAFVADGTTDNVSVVSVRGSSDVDDWLMDFNQTQVLIGGVGYHYGFYTYANSLYASVKAELASSCTGSKARPVWFTGHSLGGATAQIMAYWAARDGCNVGGVMTFGAPRSGTSQFVSAYRSVANGTLHARSHRWVNKGDPLACLPMGVIWDHAGGHQHNINDSGSLSLNSSADRCEDPDDLYTFTVWWLDLYADFSVIGLSSSAANFVDNALMELKICEVGVLDTFIDCFLFMCSRTVSCAAIKGTSNALALQDGLNRIAPRIPQLIELTWNNKHNIGHYVQGIQKQGTPPVGDFLCRAGFLSC